jgi:predicted glutamine amidotransferase
MCRWMAWSGQPVLVGELLFNVQHGLIDQSSRSRMGAATIDGDGFGLGCYGAGEGPGVDRMVAPVWRGANLHHLAADLSPRTVARRVHEWRERKRSCHG